MSASPEVAAAFEAWSLAELACHYATPCPDEVLDALTGRAHDAEEALFATPTANADDALLKIFPTVLYNFEPRKDEPPLRPSLPHTHALERDFVERLCATLAAGSPLIRSAMEYPHRDQAE